MRKILLLSLVTSLLLGTCAILAQTGAASEAAQHKATEMPSEGDGLFPVSMTRSESKRADKLAAPTRHECSTTGNTTICICGDGGDCVRVYALPNKATWHCGCS